VGDPEQLGPIEAGGLFSAIAERTEPVHLEDVIRHNHELDRDAAKLIREGAGREVLSLYRSEERITVAGNAEERRVAMVKDWWQSYAKGEDALMVAKRNSEVERLNATARELVKAEGRLGAEEIVVGGSPFAAGDLLITRVNDRRAGIYNRERWEVAAVDVERGRVVLKGIDQARRVEIGRDYLDRTTLGGEAPALQHAYAVTTYCAQGATVDRAYVMVDPSMDKQEMYVAASRTREQTYFYAALEIQAERSEYAPTGPERDPIAHVGEAAERDRAQTAAHDEALRAELRKLPRRELESRERELEREASQETRQAGDYTRAQEQAEIAVSAFERARSEREAVEGMGRKERKRELPFAQSQEEMYRHNAEQALEKVRAVEPPTHAARRAHNIARGELAERDARELLAIRLSTPTYVTRELGERPSDPRLARAWDRGVTAIQGYRREREITDTMSALGERPKTGIDRAAQRRVREVQRRLGLQQQLDRLESIERDIGFGR